VPLAVTLNVAICPAVTVWLAGCDVIEGATAGALKVRVALLLLVALPAELVTTTEKVDPLSVVVVAGVV